MACIHSAVEELLKNVVDDVVQKVVPGVREEELLNGMHVSLETQSLRSATYQDGRDDATRLESLLE